MWDWIQPDTMISSVWDFTSFVVIEPDPRQGENYLKCAVEVAPIYKIDPVVIPEFGPVELVDS